MAGAPSPASAGTEEEVDHPPPALAVEVILADPAWRRLVPRAEALARRAVAAALRGSGEGGTVSVLLADDRELRRLNGEHRGKDKPTNVLSFPGMGDHLGDIALALGVVRREAQAAGKRPGAHFAHLVAHGALHLVGHDHLAAGEARRMERAEARAMHRLRLPNPWKPETARGAAA
ncbi:rRNA maturation RNase YbeY [Paracraurococcus ruber]|uniref:rRNA maturation RNase YbeY n=1 Tax=Paracraurococcus ruber TaxID=77675 RepID=UPI001F018C16|nr:rRNA maturation RNase YbeY [Paracraurococcus ruber]